ncbi:unnamed protein product [Cercopithifilaria johnstoni]|uniref:Adenylate kinase n=1 Tax=Cercopithifilaria johnstoni TaxID=2874296 RepID=A0A8J2Q9K8_9BILA|nr:unnamed protein product [Cercopithifilaria johnstoni]
MELQSLITGLICNKPEDPIGFLGNSLDKVRQNPSFEYKWDSFVDNKVLREYDKPVKSGLKVAPTEKSEKAKKGAKSKTRTSGVKQAKRVNLNRSVASTVATSDRSSLRPSSAMHAAEMASIPDVPIILFMGGPGGGKTRHAARVQEALNKFGLVHICMPDMIRAAISKYQNTDLEWKEAAERYQRGELIPNNLALGLVKAEMSKHQNAKAFFLEGFPREARQVENFEREVRPINMAMILDYDENTLRNHMESRGLNVEVIDAKIREFKLKTLPSAKYFDDQRLLHLIPGEQSDQWIFERMKLLIQRAMELGIPVTTSKVASRTGSPLQRLDSVTTVTQAAAIVEAAVANAEISENQSRPATKTEIKGNEKIEDERPISITGAETNTTTKLPEKITPEMTSEKDKPPTASKREVSEKDKPSTASKREVSKKDKPSTASKREVSEKDKPSTASKRELSSEENASDESKSREAKDDSAIKPDTNISQVSEAINETAAQSTPTSPITTNNGPNVERSSQSSKQSTRSGNKKASGKIHRIVSQTSKSSEISRQSVNSAKSERQSLYSVKSETQQATDESATYSDNRFPFGLPNNASVIIIVGPPGSNKAEISKYLANRYDGFMYLSMGDLLRKEIQANIDDQLWQRIEQKMNAGEPVPTKICRELLYSKIYDENNDCNGYVIEGYPRTKKQAIDFENQIDRLTLVILIDCTEEFCIETIEKRSKDQMTARENDNAKAINSRLQMFKQNALPMLKYFDEKGKLKVFDGDNNLEKIFEEIVEELDSIISSKEQEDEGNRPLSEESSKRTAG